MRLKTVNIYTLYLQEKSYIFLNVGQENFLV